MRESPSSLTKSLSLVLAYLCSMAAVRADTNFPIALTGFNRDVVLENTAPTNVPFPTSLVQNFNAGETRAFYQNGFTNKTLGLPVSGAFTNPTTFDVFQYQSYTGKNALILSSDTAATACIRLLSSKVGPGRALPAR